MKHYCAANCTSDNLNKMFKGVLQRYYTLYLWSELVQKPSQQLLYFDSWPFAICVPAGIGCVFSCSCDLQRHC